MSLKEVFENISVVKDYPKKGITFRHIGPLLRNTKLFKYAIQQLYGASKNEYDIVCGLDARGFIIATAIQEQFDIPQVMIRKQSKLPGETYKYEYKKEYGIDTLELEVGSIKPGQKVLIVDDLMATAGTLLAAANLVEKAGGIVSGFMVLIEFDDMHGRDKLKKYDNIHSLFSLNSSDDTTILTENVKTPIIPIRPEVKKYRPTIYPKTDDLPVLMWYHTMETFAQKILSVSNFRPSYVNWDYFPDTWPNFTFEPSNTLINKDLVFVMSISRKEIFTEQLALLVALPRQLINSLTIIVPYLGPATHERVDYSGQLATVEPILKILSSCIPMTKTGPPILRIYDIHALQIRFYANDNMTMKLMSAVNVLIEYLKTKNMKYAIAFPDDGAHKRFKYFFSDFPQVVCSKIRDGDTRKIIIREKINWPEESIDNVIIIDDLVQSGGTLLSCAESLKQHSFKNVSAYATHAIFPCDSWKKFTNCDIIDEFIITDTNPEVSDKLVGVKPFTVLSVASHLCSELGRNNNKIAINEPVKITNVYVSSTNEAKVGAVYKSFAPQHYEIHSVKGISSGISEQPFGIEETNYGSHCRMIGLMASIDDPDAVYISIENGIIEADSDYGDLAVIHIKLPGMPVEILHTEIVSIPKKYNDTVEKVLDFENRSCTFGSIIEKKLGTNDWHKYVSGKSRKDIIADRIKEFRRINQV